MLDNFTIKNFRGIKELTLPKLSRVNLFVGKNGVGKTSVLEAVELWASSGTPSSVFTLLGNRQENRLGASRSQQVRQIFRRAEEGIELSGRVTGESSELRLVMRLGVGENNAPVMDVITTKPNHVTAAFLLDHPAQPEFEPLTKSRFVRSALEHDYISRLWSELEQTPGEEQVNRAVRILFPEIISIRVRQTCATVLVEGNPGPVPAARLGEGVVRMFAIAVALVRAAGGILLIDEFENGLHYSIQQTVWKYLIRLATELNVQVFATTHSRDAVYALAEASNEDDHMVYRLSREGDDIVAKQFDSKRLEYVVGDMLEIR